MVKKVQSQEYPINFNVLPYEKHFCKEGCENGHRPSSQQKLSDDIQIIESISGTHDRDTDFGGQVP